VCVREREQSKAVTGRERVCVSERERAVKGRERQSERELGGAWDQKLRVSPLERGHQCVHPT